MLFPRIITRRNDNLLTDGHAGDQAHARSMPDVENVIYQRSIDIVFERREVPLHVHSWSLKHCQGSPRHYDDVTRL
jgi:hypothetical protein